MNRQLTSQLTRAVQMHRAGQRQAARQEYARLLNSAPGLAEAWQMLGALDFEEQRLDGALENMRRAVELEPNNAHYAHNIGLVYRALGRLAEAETSLRRAVEFDPDHVAALGNLGQVLLAQRRPAEAVESLQRASNIAPDSHTHLHLGLAFSMQGQLEDALRSYESACRLDPTNGAAQANLGVVLQRLGRFVPSAEALGKAIKLEPNVATHWANLGVTLTQLGKPQDAVSVLLRATELAPKSRDAWTNLGVALVELGQLDQALQCYHQALQIDPQSAELWNNLATAFKEAGRLADAVPAYRRSLELQPSASTGSNLLFCLTYDPTVPYNHLMDEHKQWAARYGQPSSQQIGYANVRDPDRRLRIGYVSPDFRQHAIALFIEPVLANHDPRRVEVFAYAEVPAPDETTRRFQQLVPHWRWTQRMSDDELNSKIREDQIDILVDLAGHTARNRLPALSRKPAPIQALWMGYPSTTGLPAFDYILTDEVLNPSNEREPRLEPEQFFRLPCAACFQPRSDCPEVGPLPMERRGCITFGSPHNLAKIHGGVIETWARILASAPSARLLFFRGGLTGSTVERVRQQFADRGCDPGRLEFRNVSLQTHGYQGYMSTYHDVDLCLDTFPANAGTTVCESFWMGVPFLTLRGSHSFGRQTAAASTQVGLIEFIASSVDDYVKTAVGWSKQAAALAELRRTLRQSFSSSRLGNPPLFVQELEAAYRDLWRRWCAV